jgi:hypothetical protein
MRIHLRFLRQSEITQEALQRDGWKLEWERADSLFARHPLVENEAAARHRLHDLGLLTARFLSIEFIQPRGSFTGR